MEIAIALGQLLIGAIPKIVAAIRAGRDPKDIKLGDVVSHAALERLKAVDKKVDDFVNNG